jgi:molybdate transport system substrate-binding protein
MSTPGRILAPTAVLWLVAMSGGTVASPARAAETVEIFAAGSLRGVVAELAKEAGPVLDIDVKSSFGGSGLMRERIEKGETPDLFLSADVGSPRKLAAAGRTIVPAIAFARNRMCIMSRSSAGVTATNLIDRLLAKGVRVKTSTPIADPAGDYAWTIFDRIDALRPGSGALLKSKAQELMNNNATGSALFLDNKIDMSITYCSAAPTLEKDVSGLTSLVVPPQLDPHPLYGAAVLSNKLQAWRLALYLLSDQGQAIIAREGLVPLAEGPAPTPPR